MIVLDLPSGTKTLRESWRFFMREAGYRVGFKAFGALELAKAETWVSEVGLADNYEVEEDERAYCYCENTQCQYHEGSTHEWETLFVSLRDNDGTVLASLGGIMAPSREYLRVVKAQLALQVHADEAQLNSQQLQGAVDAVEGREPFLSNRFLRKRL